MTGVSQNGCRKNTLAFLLVHDEHKPHASPTFCVPFFSKPLAGHAVPTMIHKVIVYFIA
jgi:hypothetical protein